MKSDLDALMKERKLDALIVLGDAQHNPPMYYFTGGGHVTSALLVKKQGEAPVLFYNDMEREEAARSGLKVRSFNEFSLDGLLEQANGDMTQANALRFQKILNDLGLASARIGVYGHTEFSGTFNLVQRLQKLLPDVEFIGEGGMSSVFLRAMETKDESEVAHVRAMGKVTVEVVRRGAEYLTNCEVVADGALPNEDSTQWMMWDYKPKSKL